MGSGKVLPHGRVQNLEESGASQLNIASSDGFESSICSLFFLPMITQENHTVHTSKT